MRLSKMLFFLCLWPTIKFQDGSPVDPLFEPPCRHPFTRPLKNYFYRHFGVSEMGTQNNLPPPPESKIELWVAKSTVDT